MAAGVFNIAENLEQYNVNGWHVLEKLQSKGTTGGNFSIGYVVVNEDGVKGFLKALDYSRALRSIDSAQALQAMTNAYIFERDLLKKCCDKKLHYVVKLLDAGHFQLDETQVPEDLYIVSLAVDYIVLEYADTSLRTIIDLSQSFDYAWALRSLHNIAVGISELHGIQVAHQDIKPSNILVFKKENSSKLGDMGRSSDLGRPVKHDELKCAGDCNYSPFEQLYGEVLEDWKLRRYSCDMFMFGNLIMLYFNNISVTNAVLNNLPPEQHYTVWGDSYQAVRPFIDNAFAKCVDQFNEGIDSELRKELMTMVCQMCNPDVAKRGDLSKAHLYAQQYSLERYISRLDFLAKKYEYKFKKVLP